MNIEQARFNMIEQQIRTWEVLDQGVLDLLSTIRREEFVPADSRPLAFFDLEIPLPHQQVMMPPKLEARLVQEARVQKTDRVLEIGTGSGYVTALLASLAAELVSVDIHADFTAAAAAKLARYDLRNVQLQTGDAAREWLGGPWDVIFFGGSTPVVPDSLLANLKEGGRLVAVVGDAPVMRALRIERVGAEFRTSNLFDTCVPPLINALEPERFVF